MLDYALSKINMLIMVTAIFAIMTYFAFYLGRSLEKQQADLVLSNMTEDAFGVLNSSSICHQVNLTLPPYINTLGRADSGDRLYYVLQVHSQTNIKPGSDPQLNAIIFSIRDKKTKEILAARQINTTAAIELFSWSSGLSSSQAVSRVNPPDNNIELNPQSAISPENAIRFIKEVYNGESTLFVIPCSTSNNFCQTNYASVVTQILSERSRFNCVNTA